MKSNNIKKWSEHDWEQEFRLQEACINNYFKELKNYIDLPAESEIIAKKLNSEESNLKSSNSDHALFFDLLDSFNSDDIDDDSDPIGSNYFIKVGQLASNFNMIVSRITKNNDALIHAHKIIASYGKLVYYILDFADIDNDEMKALKSALSKRIMSEINNIIGLITQLSECLPETKKVLNLQISELLLIRQSILEFRLKSFSAK